MKAEFRFIIFVLIIENVFLLFATWCFQYGPFIIFFLESINFLLQVFLLSKVLLSSKFFYLKSPVKLSLSVVTSFLISIRILFLCHHLSYCV